MKNRGSSQDERWRERQRQKQRERHEAEEKAKEEHHAAPRREDGSDTGVVTQATEAAGTGESTAAGSSNKDEPRGT